MALNNIKEKIISSGKSTIQYVYAHFLFRRREKQKNRINWFKTLYINLCLVEIKHAFKFPILVYGNCTLYNCKGKVCFKTDVRRGLLNIGLTDPVRSFNSKSFLDINGNLIIGKNVTLRRGINLQILHGAKVVLNDFTYIGDNCTIIARKNIQIGYGTRVGNNTTFMDTDFHFIINTATKEVKNNVKEIEIGDYNWIGGNCIIKKGTKTPKGTILAGPFSMIGKDYTERIPEYSIIAGSPAKLLCSNFRRINNDVVEREMWREFEKGIEVFRFNNNTSIDDICLPPEQTK